jgi:hypothetical protein
MCSLQQSGESTRKKKSPALGGAVSGGNGEVAVGDAKKNTDLIQRTVINVTRRYRHSASFVRAVAID